jgi:hypothetical protein
MAGANDVKSALADWAERRKAAIIALAQDWAGTLEGRAKDNAPWTDRTGNARNGLFGRTIVKNDEVIIALAHSMEYGVFLELARDGKFAILEPTLKQAQADIYRTYKRLWEGY